MERAKAKIDTTILDNMIVGRVEPHIYAFSTETVPNYLKVGDTYRPVSVRLKEWQDKDKFPDATLRYDHSAQINEDTIFRDFAVHDFLEHEKGRHRLQRDDIKNLPYYSKEFFESATIADLDEAIADIHLSAKEQNGKYQLYSPDRLPQTLTYERTENYPPRDNQRLAINNFKNAVEAGRTNLLLYAVMRFGKSFTSMCCAKEIHARFVVIVSAKADVKEEWKKTVESHIYFVGYKYLDSDALKRNETVIADTLAESNKSVALFLTLQDLQGDDIKEKHKEVFNRQIDLLIIDETHFSARGESYGKVLQEQKLSKSQINRELKSLDGFETLDRIEGAVKALNAKIRLHLSGTPYRILMSDEFKKEDIIAFVQFTDIIDAQQKWNDEHLDSDEWDNPYYGFPQMIRFAFNPNESSRKKMEQIRKEGITYAFSELFRPLSIISKTDGRHRQFNHETEILDLLEVIDGTKEDENLLGFLDYNKIKEGKMCRHIVCVLPFRASCDAMAALIQGNRARFKNLGDYEIINIAGFDDKRKYKTTDDVKRAIKECENQNKKTLTLTVNRMLTGTTVPQWDTMLYLKDTASPQEYDQAIFRLQNQYITTFKDESGKTIKYNMKPQTLLVDFDPNRMFILQELKSQFYNVNTEVQGNAQLKEQIQKELKVSPIIVLNKNKLRQAEPTDITDAVREYSRTRSILDDASEIPTDNNLLQDDALAAILRTIEPIDAKNGLQIKPTEGDGDDIDTPDGKTDNPKEEADKKDAPTANPQQSTDQEDDDKLEKRLAAYYARVLFFAFLTESTVKSLEDVIAQILATDDNRRIARNLGLKVGILKRIQCKSNPFVLRRFDYKIENVNDLSRDASLSSIQRVEVALRKFGRLSDSEVVTPARIADEMVSILPFDKLNAKKDAKFLDIASKQGEFTIALYKRFGDKAKEHIYAIPTSKLTYEFTRKTYKLLGMPLENIFADFVSYDLIGKDNEKIINRLKDMKFDAIIGNPPYQESDGGGRESSAISLYHKFIECSNSLSTTFVSMIIPARWYSGGKGLSDFRSMMLSDTHISLLYDFPETSDCFDRLNIRGGVCYFLRNKSYNGNCIVYNIKNRKIQSSVQRPLLEPNCDFFIRYNAAISILNKIRSKDEDTFGDVVSARNPFGIASNFTDYKEVKDRTHTIKLYRFGDDAYIKSSQITRNADLITKWKVLVSKASPGGDEYPHAIVSRPIISEPNSVCTETYLVIQAAPSKMVARNIVAYIQTRFFRFLVSLIKNTQNISRVCYSFVPKQDFSAKSNIDWSKSIREIDAQLYAKYGLSVDEITFIESMIKPME